MVVDRDLTLAERTVAMIAASYDATTAGGGAGVRPGLLDAAGGSTGYLRIEFPPGRRNPVRVGDPDRSALCLHVPQRLTQWPQPEWLAAHMGVQRNAHHQPLAATMLQQLI